MLSRNVKSQWWKMKLHEAFPRELCRHSWVMQLHHFSQHCFKEVGHHRRKCKAMCHERQFRALPVTCWLGLFCLKFFYYLHREILEEENSCPHGTKVHPPPFLEGTLEENLELRLTYPKLVSSLWVALFHISKEDGEAPFPDNGIACFGHEQHQLFTTSLFISWEGADSYIWCFQHSLFKQALQLHMSKCIKPQECR